MNEWWNAPKPIICIPINVFGPDDERQTCAPDELLWEEAKKWNHELFTCKSSWFWFWGIEGSAWRMVLTVLDEDYVIGPMGAA